MSGFSIICGLCSESSPIDRWIETPAGEKLPDGHFQCCNCKTAIIRKNKPPIVKIANGVKFLLPSSITIERTEYIRSMSLHMLKYQQGYSK